MGLGGVDWSVLTRYVRGVFAELTDTGMDVLRAAAPGHLETVRDVLIDVLTLEQREQIANGLGEVARRLRA